MANLIVMVGNVGSGKSTKAKEIALYYHAYIVESDAVREKLFPNPKFTKEEHKQVFEEVHKLIEAYMKADINVIFDATNINAVRRIELLERFDGLYSRAICYYVRAGLDTCLLQNQMRERKVPEGVILRYAIHLQAPSLLEGWDEIVIIEKNSKKVVDGVIDGVIISDYTKDV